MTLANLLTSPAADALGWTLLHALWQGFVIVLPVAAVLHLLRNRSSVLRYRLGCLALLLQLLVSALTFGHYYAPATSVNYQSVRQLAVASWRPDLVALPWYQQVQQFLNSHLSQFVLVYLIGLLLFGLRLVGGWLYLQRLSRRATPPANPLWQTVVDRLRTTMALRSLVRIRETARLTVPVVVGVVRPILLIPASLATSLSTQELEAVLAHELAHVKRQDYAINLIQSLIDVLYFFHPALWWLSARVREERELCCDDLAVQACGGNGRRLAQALARIEELRLLQPTTTPALAMAFATKRLQLLHRVRRMLGVPTRPLASNGSLAGLTLVTLLLLSASVYAIQQQAGQPKPKPAGTRTLKRNAGSELHFDDKHKLKYVTWRGKRLPASRVASLQRQWEQVMTGRLNLDNVKQPDRDILLSVIESNSALDKETYQDIAANALKNVPLSPNGTVEGLANVNYDSIIQRAFSSVDTTWFSRLSQLQQQAKETDKQVQELLAERSSKAFFDKATAMNQQIDAGKQALEKGKIALLKAQAEQQRFAADAAHRQLAIIDAQRFRLEQQRMAKAMEQQRIVMQTRLARTDSAQAALSRQIAESERAIQQAEAEIEKANKQLVEKEKAIEEAMKPVRETEEQLRKLGYSDWQLHSGVGAISIPGTGPVGTVAVDVPVPLVAPFAVTGKVVRLPAPPVPPVPLRTKTRSGKGTVRTIPRPPVPPRALTIEPEKP